jgi:uncharacterized membrane protein YkvA (DUF1232 family)
MAKKKSDSLMVPPNGGMLQSLVVRLKLIVRLMGDRRVNPLLKLLPIATLVYLVSPIDFLMGLPGISALDDAAIVSLGAYLFVEFCPPHVVQEHLESLRNEGHDMTGNGEIVDGETTEIDEGSS